MATARVLWVPDNDQQGDGTNVRVRAPVTGRDYPWLEEIPRNTKTAALRLEAEVEARRLSEARAETAEAQVEAANARIAELEARLRQAGH